MAIAGRTPEEIAAEFATDPINVSVFLKLFFDVEPLLPYDALLQEVVSQAQTQPPGNNVAPQEALWLRLAYQSNWDVLQSVMFGRPLRNPSRVVERIDHQMTGQLAIRAREFTEARMLSSEPGSSSDLRSYHQHKRLSQKIGSDPNSGDEKAKKGIGNLNAAYMDSLGKRTREFFATCINDGEWRALLIEDQLAAAERKERLSQYTDLAEDEELQESETAAYQKALDERAGRRAAIEANLKKYFDEFAPVMWPPPVTGVPRTKSKRASHWDPE